jgi:hypothetical protein
MLTQVEAALAGRVQNDHPFAEAYPAALTKEELTPVKIKPIATAIEETDSAFSLIVCYKQLVTFREIFHVNDFDEGVREEFADFETVIGVRLSRLIPSIGNFPQRLLAANYSDFVDVLYSDIDTAIVHLQENAHLTQKDSEDRLSMDLLGKLHVLGYDATHDTGVRGHCDLTVRNNGFTWLGEAKIHDSYDYLLEGFNQLCTRYSTGDHASAAGGVVIYIRQRAAASVMSKWKDHLKENADVPTIAVAECAARPALAFFSEHEHEVSGLPYKVRHMGVCLHFQPKDKSGEKTRANRFAKTG